MESKLISDAQNSNHLTHYESHNGQIWVRTMDDEELLFKFYDPNIKEEKDIKKIKDE